MDITVIKKGARWIARFPFSYQTKDKVKDAGFRFDGTEKVWWTSDPNIAQRLEESDSWALLQNSAKSSVSETESRASIPSPTGKGYLPFQKAGIEYLSSRSDALLADDMGLGKTIQVIGLINMRPDLKNVLIIPPASLKLNWKAELERWLVRKTPVSIVNGDFPILVGDSNIVIVNYEQVSKHRNAIDGVNWDLLVVDESHYLKTAKAQRTIAVLGRWSASPGDVVHPIRARKRVFLTGTPLLNRPKELWTTVKALDPGCLGRNYKDFHEKYCAGYKTQYGWQVDGASNLDELNALLRVRFMLRRKKEDVLSELPQKRRQLILLPPLTPETVLALEAERSTMETQYGLEYQRQFVEELSVNRASEEYKKAVQKLNVLEATAFDETAGVRHNTALAKVPLVIQHLKDALESEDKVVVFAHHHDVIDGLLEGLKDYGAIKMDGRDPLANRPVLVRTFQLNPNTRVLIGSIGAMGYGFTLTAASYVAFAELDWVPGSLSQAEDRLHRIGQRHSVLVQHLMLDGSFDGRMAQVVIDKMGVIQQAIG